MHGSVRIEFQNPDGIVWIKSSRNLKCRLFGGFRRNCAKSEFYKLKLYRKIKYLFCRNSIFIIYISANYYLNFFLGCNTYKYIISGVRGIPVYLYLADKCSYTER